jgi:prepilin-type N-terminal cleavage/methylation domain-containing protein
MAGAARRGAGFTLIELVVALAIVGLALSIAVVALAPGRASSGLRAAESEVRAALRAAHSAAMTMNREIRFAVEAPGRTYLLGGQRYAFRTPGFATGEIVAESGPLAFYPTGGSSGGRVVVKSARRTAAIEVDPSTARLIDVR